MRSARATSPASRKASTRDQLLEAAEQLFGRNGIAHVSLEEIALKAGAANKSAVQYHFGSRDDLIRAIFERRIPQLDLRRAELLAEVSGTPVVHQPATLVRILFQPVAELVDASKRHVWAAFLLAAHEFKRDKSVMEHAALHLFQNTGFVYRLLQKSLPAVPEALLSSRMYPATVVFLDMLVRQDEKRVAMTADEAFREGITLATAIVTAAVP